MMLERTRKDHAKYINPIRFFTRSLVKALLRLVSFSKALSLAFPCWQLRVRNPHRAGSPDGRGTGVSPLPALSCRWPVVGLLKRTATHLFSSGLITLAEAQSFDAILLSLIFLSLLKRV